MAEADPSKTFNVHEAKTNFSRLLDRAHAGEEIVIAKSGKPYARLVKIEESESLPPRVPGRLKHIFGELAELDWSEPAFTDEEIDEYENRPIGQPEF